MYVILMSSLFGLDTGPVCNFIIHMKIFIILRKREIHKIKCMHMLRWLMDKGKNTLGRTEQCINWLDLFINLIVKFDITYFILKKNYISIISFMQKIKFFPLIFLLKFILDILLSLSLSLRRLWCVGPSLLLYRDTMEKELEKLSLIGDEEDGFTFNAEEEKKRQNDLSLCLVGTFLTDKSDEGDRGWLTFDAQSKE